ncbi:hypothetical protein [Saccharopolyspora spinosa]|nr:hypothetical protein [Saccharopolyspora spinosa]
MKKELERSAWPAADIRGWSAADGSHAVGEQRQNCPKVLVTGDGSA